jgi:hypothetical protein
MLMSLRTSLLLVSASITGKYCKIQNYYSTRFIVMRVSLLGLLLKLIGAAAASSSCCYLQLDILLQLLMHIVVVCIHVR